MSRFFSRLLGRRKKPARKPLNERKNEKLGTSLDSKKKILDPYVQKNRDVIFREITIKADPHRRAAVVYLEGRTDKQVLYDDIFKSLMSESETASWRQSAADQLIDRISQTSLAIGEISKVDSVQDLIHSLFDGLTLVMVDGISEVLAVNIEGGVQRSPEEPPVERSLHSSREGFIENLQVNISMVRRRLRDPNLVVEETIVGRRTRTDVAILYIEDIADPEIVRNVKDKLNRIDVDGISAIGYLEQFMSDNHYSPFPQFRSSERPDKVVMELLEGRVAIMAEGTSGVLIIPTLFISFLHTSEDYYDRPILANVNRLARYLAFIIAVSLPPLYISLLSFQPELIPYELFVVLAQARTQVPFPVLVEVLIQEIIIQLVVEAGLRMPTGVGQTVGVVAGIVLGEAAISANIASPAIIIVIAITTIASFALPNNNMVLASRLVRILLIIATAVFGLFGFSLGWFILVTHLISLESFGVPYFAPFGPVRYGDMKDSLFKGFIWKSKYRPQSIPVVDRQRQGEQNG